MTKQLATLSEKNIAYVRNSIDLMVNDFGGEYPVLASVLVKHEVATEKALKTLEEEGHIRSMEVEIPSTIVLGQTVKMKAYYTERQVPTYATN